MAKKGRKVKHTYKLKHLGEWEKLRANYEPPKINNNTNQLWRWDTLEDVKQTK